MGVAALLAILFVIPAVTSDLQLRRLSQLIVLVLAVLGVNLLTGYTGLISLGHGVFVGIGAFLTANLLDTGMPLWTAVVIATALTGGIGIVLGLPAIRLRGISLALITFGYAVAFQPISKRFGRFTGGTGGRRVDAEFMPPAALGIDDYAPIWRYVVCLAVVATWFLLIRNLINSRMGRAARAVRDGERAAEQFGVDVVAVKTGVLAVSAAMTGTAGALQVAMFPWVSADQFDTLLSLRLYAAAVLGGLGTMLGALFGIIALIVFPVINNLTGVLDNDAVVFGLGLVIMSLVAPNGLAGLIARRGATAAAGIHRWWEVPEATLLRDPEERDLRPTVHWIDIEMTDAETFDVFDSGP